MFAHPTPIFRERRKKLHRSNHVMEKANCRCHLLLSSRRGRGGAIAATAAITAPVVLIQ